MTTVYPQAWERTLLPLAYEAENQVVAPTLVPVSDPALLDRAYGYCTSITAAHSHTFYMATGLLPPAKRRAMRALYAFCRLSDDLVWPQRSTALCRRSPRKHRRRMTPA